MSLMLCARSAASRIVNISHSVRRRPRYFSSAVDTDSVVSAPSTANDEVTVTTYSSRSSSSSDTPKSYPLSANNSMKLVDRLLQRTSEMMDPHAANVIAFSGGVDSSLVAALVHRAFNNYHISYDSNPSITQRRGSLQAVLGISAAVSQTQIIMARTVAQTIGIELTEVPTSEGSDETYQRNDGYACFVCKTHLYSTLENVANTVMKQQLELRQQLNDDQQQKDDAYNSVILYNGTNADDRTDPTRLGLIAASNFQVHSPLDQITKDEVRAAAKHLGLPNWNAAASPCLRSRLAMGVMATSEHLRAVEKAEEFVRNVLNIDEAVNARVRMLAGGRAVVELDNSILMDTSHHQFSGDDSEESWVARSLRESGFEMKCINEWGFKSFGGVRGFKTGSVAAMPEQKIMKK
ncbi:hypothetical protein ACHAWU_009008 [Discostella pseudostelligera]|uniref:Asparagine synthetase domain-containing protein n=1 Tax=Discostella pseudostelligera TaxID=259834 RepID=A0ABD3MG34_9STRA